jgi:GT2 family glycosyltransferase
MLPTILMQEIDEPANTGVSVIVLNWRNAADTEVCLESLHRVTRPILNVIVVDNASGDGSAERLEAWVASRRSQGDFWRRLMIVRSPVNLGYAGGNNLGIRAALEQGAEYVIVLNNDTQVDPEFAFHLVKVAQEVRHTAVVGAVIATLPDRKTYFAGGTVRLLRHHYRGTPAADVDFAPTDIVSGSCLLLTREFLVNEGLLCEKMFLYGEEMELCHRALSREYAVSVAYRSRVFHKISASMSGMTASQAYYNHRSKLILARRILTPLARAAYHPVYYVNIVRRLAEAAHDPIMRQAICEAVRDGRRDIGGVWQRHGQ